LIFELVNILNFDANAKPIQALEHPKFKEMIDVASRATKGVKIPGRKATRAEIIRTFKDHLTKLKVKLNVGHDPMLPYLVLFIRCLLERYCEWCYQCDL
jgi:hypothetical protein